MKKRDGYFHKRHNRFFVFFKWLVAPFFRRKFAYTYTDIPRVDGPCIVLANHNTDYDPILISLASHKLMYFVTSEHVMRAGLASKALAYMFAPISRIKGSVASSTVMQILRRLRDGHTVCMFAEGNRSFDGMTGHILPATAKLVKSSKATLITYHFTGSYFTSPRWSVRLRRGRMTGSPVRVYTPAELATMSAEAVYDAICRDLDENAYERQAVERIPYRGRRLAEALETVLFLCPRCGGIGTMHAKGAHLVCSCGLDVTYSVLGYLSLPDMNTVPKWDAWQRNRFAEMTDAHRAFTLYDEGVRLSSTDESHRAVELYRGSIRMTREELAFGDMVFPIADIVALALCGRNTIVFTAGNQHYEVKSRTRYCARKYLLWYERLHPQQA